MDVRDHVDEAHAGDEHGKAVVVTESAQGAQSEADDIDEAAEDENAGYSEVIVVASPHGQMLASCTRAMRRVVGVTHWDCQ